MKTHITWNRDKVTVITTNSTGIIKIKTAKLNGKYGADVKAQLEQALAKLQLKQAA